MGSCSRFPGDRGSGRARIEWLFCRPRCVFSIRDVFLDILLERLAIPVGGLCLRGGRGGVLRGLGTDGEVLREVVRSRSREK